MISRKVERGKKRPASELKGSETRDKSKVTETKKPLTTNKSVAVPVPTTKPVKLLLYVNERIPAFR